MDTLFREERSDPSLRVSEAEPALPLEPQSETADHASQGGAQTDQAAPVHEPAAQEATDTAEALALTDVIAPRSSPGEALPRDRTVARCSPEAPRASHGASLNPSSSHYMYPPPAPAH